ncbi:MAG: TolB-like 6-bladed beta-propeller domain-containing protein, partial [Tannerella sp.]|nr:TolB-like 6-bladed beta-propeller domain-containing protein [Tannerella sp.]
GKRNLDLNVHTHFDLNTCVDFVCLDDTTLLLGDLSGRNRLLRATPGRQTGILTLPSEPVQGDGANGYVWRSYMDMNYELNKAVLATQFGEVLEIVDLSDYSVVRTIGEGSVPHDASQQLAGYYDVKWRKNDIYVLYSGMSEDEANRRLAANQRPSSGGDQIHVFDQNGIRTKIYRLDVSINSFTVDEKNNQLIGISSESDYPVYLFRLD